MRTVALSLEVSWMDKEEESQEELMDVTGDM